MCNNFCVPRKYELKRRAERQAETRRRIVEAAVALHRRKGPARTTFTDIARLAGVQRHTLYRHFPDERALMLACSGLFYEQNPPPDPERWREIGDGLERLRHGLRELYAYYERTEDMASRVLRDAEVHPLTRELVELRRSGPMRCVRAVLGEGFSDEPRVQALLDLATDFYAWRRLARSGLSPDDAAALMADLLLCALE